MYLRLLGEVTSTNAHFLGMVRGILVVSDPSGLGFSWVGTAVGIGSIFSCAFGKRK